MPTISGKAAEAAFRALRQAAIERIRFFQEALAERGILARVGAELEFFPLNQKGVPQDDLLDAKKLTAALQSVATIERVHQETIASRAQYELVTGLNRHKSGTTIHDSSPLAAAETVDAFKHALLRNAKRLGLSGVAFKARMQAGTALQNSGLHVNLSLWDGAGRSNLFYQHFKPTTDLERHVVDSMIQTHATSVPAYFPFADSYERIAASARGTITNPDFAMAISSAVPTRAGYMANKGTTLVNAYNVLKSAIRGEPEIGSIAGRHGDLLHKPLGLLEGLAFPGRRSSMIGWEKPSQYRLESRLAGADADPYIAIAADLASAYEAVTHHVRPFVHGMIINSTTEKLINAGEKSWVVTRHQGPFDSLPLALNSTVGHQAFASNARMRALLGEDLFHGITATTRPIGIDLATKEAVEESTNHFQRMVRGHRGNDYDKTTITDGIQEAFDATPRSVVNEKGKTKWTERIGSNLGKSRY
ncbi:MAG: glutamine synthetase [Rickettsiales bacterium]|nr:glutamine synthetase [Rickettsiales bacterium]